MRIKEHNGQHLNVARLRRGRLLVYTLIFSKLLFRCCSFMNCRVFIFGMPMFYNKCIHTLCCKWWQKQFLCKHLLYHKAASCCSSQTSSAFKTRLQRSDLFIVIETWLAKPKDTEPRSYLADNEWVFTQDIFQKVTTVLRKWWN